MSMFGAARADDAARQEAAATAAAHTRKALRTDCFGLGRGQHPAKTLLELHLGLPAEQLLRPRDVRLADLRVVDRQRFVHDLALRAGQPYNGLGKLEQRELAGIADVDREMLAAPGEQVEAA